MSCIDHGFAGDKDGYSQKDLGRGKRKPFRHRLVYAEAHGLDEATMGGVVMHSCDNPRCINIAHLTLGTHTDNMADRAAKGRQASGEKNGSAKLTAEQVVDMRNRYVRGRGGNGPALQAEFGISQGLFSQIINGRLWNV